VSAPAASPSAERAAAPIAASGAGRGASPGEKLPFAARLERNLAYGGLGISALVLILFTPVLLERRWYITPTFILTLCTFVWYGGELLLIRRRFFRPWMGYASTALEAVLGSIICWIDYHRDGALGAATGAGILLYGLTVAAATLRLGPRLALFEGGLASAQILVLFGYFFPTAADPRLAGQFVLPATFPVTVIKAAYVFGLGVIGMVGALAIRRLQARAKERAIERERVRNLFSLYVSDQVVEQVIAGNLKPDGERRVVSVLFSDIRGFTTLSESRKPEEVLRLLNLYFDRMCAVVERWQGVVFKFVGDGLLVVFGAPNVLPDDARAALGAARDMVAEAGRLAASGEFPGLKIGVGIHRGEAVVGPVGGALRQEYAAIGATVTTGARVEGLVKTLGRPILLTADVRAALDEPERATLDAVGVHALPGRGVGVELYAPRGAA